MSSGNVKTITQHFIFFKVFKYMDSTQELKVVKAKKPANQWILFRKEKLAEGVKNADIRALYYSSGMDKKSKQAKLEQELAEASGDAKVHEACSDNKEAN